MIILHSRPTREYPILAKEIQYKCRNHYQFHEPFEIVNPLSFTKQDKILNYPPGTQLPKQAFFCAPSSVTTHDGKMNTQLSGLIPYAQYQIPYNINIIYGVFPEKRIIYDKNFVFTCIEHPADMLYKMYYYNKFTLADNKISSLKILTGDFFNISIEKFIDLFLDNQIADRVFMFQNIGYKVIKDYYITQRLDKYNYILFTDNMEKGLDNLGYHIGVRFYCPSNIKPRICGEFSYRRSDVELFLKDQIDEYNIARQKFI